MSDGGVEGFEGEAGRVRVGEDCLGVWLGVEDCCKDIWLVEAPTGVPTASAANETDACRAGIMIAFSVRTSGTASLGSSDEDAVPLSVTNGSSMALSALCGLEPDRFREKDGGVCGRRSWAVLVTNIEAGRLAVLRGDLGL